MKYLLLCLSSLTLPASAASLIDFNTPGSISQLTVAGGSTGIAAQQSGVGFDGTGGLSITSVTRVHAFVNPQSFAGDTGSWYTSVLFKPGSATETEFSLGFASGQGVFLSGGYPANVDNTADIAQVMGSIHTNFSANGIELRSSQTGTGITDHGASFSPLSAGTWYKAALDVTYNGGGSYTARASVFSLDTSGNQTGELVFKTATFNNTSLSGDGSIYNYFAVVNNTGGVIDNFTTVPEPTSALLATMAAGVILLPRRRR